MPGTHRIIQPPAGERRRASARVDAAQGARTTSAQGWELLEYECVDSTNLVAADLPAWCAVRADVQTSGRGRFQRDWVSDCGGLWLSAVIPTGPNRQWQALPLAVGLAVCDALRLMGVSGIRLRWPNDVLVGDRKLAGVLIDQFTPGLAVAGIGVNVRNRPEERQSALKNQTARLADLLAETPSLNQLALVILASLREVVSQMKFGGFQTLLPRVNELWGQPRDVELDLDGDVRWGKFSRVDAAGRLILQSDAGNETAYDARQVRHLSEISRPK